MPADRSSPGARLPRRRFLGALAVAPAALAACATATTGGAAAPPGAPKGPAARAVPAPDAVTRAVREQPLPAGAEPAFVFRAASARPGEP